MHLSVSSFVVLKKPATGSQRRKANQAVGGISSADNHNNSGKEESKNKCSAAGSIISVKALDWRVIAAGIPRDRLFVRSFTFLDINVCLGTWLTNY